MAYQNPIAEVEVMSDIPASSNKLDRWETPIDPEVG